ncbi:hypothetical protein NF865_09805 [Thermococcus aggregans]|uniref:Uncharacterized protein n=1 Tax=Thermococcus aggregans TaxID=110163 RepID=A0A9E7MX81_THEAG|nr:hypothetical protein [Thermococcus aggregans]USS40574.1 hypothetical protein NF865_09805 [Thermococcus aggregans]
MKFTRKRSILTFYLFYVILFNLVIPTNSLVSENSFEYLPYYTYTNYSKLTYTASFYCWNGTKYSASNGQYFGCYLALKDKLPIIKGFLIKVDTKSDILIKEEHPSGSSYVGFTLNPASMGNHTITGEIQVYEFWWLGIVVPSKLKFEIELNCEEKECKVTLK